MPTLYIVGTPIGNLEDITYRAVRILDEVDIVASEDTRVTGILLKKYGISKPMISYHARSGETKSEEILSLLKEGKSIALVTDAGTPGISDPGSELVSLVREVFGTEVSIVPIPGPSAVVTALSVAGVPTNKWTFYGFLPHKKGRQTIFNEIKEGDHTAVFYESPHRIEKTLESLMVCDKKKVTIVRELTKIYESVVSGTPSEVRDHFIKNPDQVRGEFVVIVSEK